MRNTFNLVFIMPLIGLASIYIFVLAAMISLNTTNIYMTDPKSTILGDVYDIFVALPIFGFLGILVGGLFVMGAAVSPQKVPLKKGFIITYLCGTFLTIFLHFFDLGYYQFWFFD